MGKHHFRQFLTSLSAYLVSWNYGASCSWGSLSFEELQKDSSLLPTGVLSVNEASMMVTLPNFGALIGNFVFVFFGERYGHKRTILWLGVPQIVSWLLIIFAQDVYYLYVARILIGLAAGATNNCLPLFITEISDYKIRGALNSLNTLTFSFGILYGFILGRYFEYRMQAILLLLVPVVFVLTFFFVHESPNYLKKIEEDKRLKKSIKFYEGKKAVAELFKTEVKLLKSEAAVVDEKQETAEPDTEKSKLTLQDFLQPAARNAFLITLFLVATQQFSGIVVLINYTATVFVESGSSLSVIESSVIIGLVQLLANIATLFIIDKLGNKVLFVVSAAGCGLGLIALGAYNLYQTSIPDTYNWIPIVSFSFTMFIGSLGLNTVPFVLPFNILPLKVRSTAVTLVMSFMWISTFFLNIVFPLMNFYIGMHGSLFIFAGICFIAVIVALHIIPETRGRAYASIIDLLEG